MRAMAMPITAMTMTMEAMHGAAEAAMDRATIKHPIRPGHRFEPGAAAPRRCEAHGDGANRRSPHHRQHHPARPFHRWLDPKESDPKRGRSQRVRRVFCYDFVVCVKDPCSIHHIIAEISRRSRDKISAATGKAECMRKGAEAAACDMARRSVSRWRRASVTVAITVEEAVVRGVSGPAAAAAGSSRAISPDIIGLPRYVWLRITGPLARHQRISAAADRKRAHQQQCDMTGTFGGRRRDLRPTRPALAELGAMLGHDQVIIDAALSAPAESEARPSQIAGASSPAAIRCDRFGTGILTR